MNRNTALRLAAIAAIVVMAHFCDHRLLPLFVPLAFGHCDTMDGPVVKDAQKALETGKADIILKWVQPRDEAEIRKGFEQARAVRKLGKQAKELADMHFFETLVRIHRAGEGAGFDGIKPAGSEPEPGIAAADQAVASGKIDGLAQELSEQAVQAVREKFAKVSEAKKHMDESVAAGREYVEAYVTFIHFVERLRQAISGPGEHHGEQGKAEPKQEHQH